MHRGARHQHRIALHVDQHAHIGELAGKEGVVGVRELRLELDRPGGRVDLVVRSQQHPRGKLCLVGPVVRIDRELLPRAQLGHHRGQAVLGNREHHCDRLQLRDHHEPCGITRAYDVACVDLAQAEAPADRRGDPAIGQLELGRIDRGLVDLDGGLVLPDERLLRVVLLLGDRVLLQQYAIALEVDARVLEQRLVAGHLALGRRELDLVGARVDLREQFARTHHLTFLEQHAHELAVDAAAHRNGGNGRDRTKAREVDVYVAGFGRGRDHRHGSVAESTLALAFAGAALGAVLRSLSRALRRIVEVVVRTRTGRNNEQREDPHPASAQEGRFCVQVGSGHGHGVRWWSGRGVVSAL